MLSDLNHKLKFEDLEKLLKKVFALRPKEKWLSILVDLPDGKIKDNREWSDRRTLAGEWFQELHTNISRLPFSAVAFCLYPNVGSNNNDLPESMIVADRLPEYGAQPNGRSMLTADILASSSVVFALTEFSATAPLKLIAKKLGFKGATLPGFRRSMLPTLTLDYEQIHARVMELKQRMDRASGTTVTLGVDGKKYQSYYDLRFRSGHASGGLMREEGTVGNLPSGEAYIVPYEGERPGEPSRTSGLLPVQFESEIVVYRIEENNASEVISSGKHSDSERQRLESEPAYGNIAEVGIGVLGEWGITGTGSTLLDEKLGLHIAFGRSDHFGGVTSPALFRNPQNVVHIDRVYVSSLQPLIAVEEVVMEYPDGDEIIMKNDTLII